jgi:hypothetical protein
MQLSKIMTGVRILSKYFERGDISLELSAKQCNFSLPKLQVDIEKKDSKQLEDLGWVSTEPGVWAFVRPAPRKRKKSSTQP